MREIPTLTLHTIGHSNHPIERFTALLRLHDIACLADIRSYPGSRWAPQFNRRRLAAVMADAGIDYLWLGGPLGGKRDDPALLKPDGKPDYAKIVALPAFRDALEELAVLARRRPTAMMCAEEDPMRCHRTHLVGAALAVDGFAIRHIRGDSSLVEDADLRATAGAEGVQPSLFEQGAG